jgi:transposase
VGRPSIYPEEFRREACELVHQGDRSIRQVAAGLGIPDQTLCNWLKAEEKAKARGQDPEALTESELAELKRPNGDPDALLRESGCRVSEVKLAGQ